MYVCSSVWGSNPVKHSVFTFSPTTANFSVPLGILPDEFVINDFMSVAGTLLESDALPPLVTQRSFTWLSQAPFGPHFLDNTNSVFARSFLKLLGSSAVFISTKTKEPSKFLVVPSNFLITVSPKLALSHFIKPAPRFVLPAPTLGSSL